MNLDESQRKKVAEWIAEGLKLSEIQTRLASELGLRLTYMDVRLLVDDLKLTPKDVEPPSPAPPVGSPLTAPSAPDARPTPAQPGLAGSKQAKPGGAPGGISLTVDQLTRPGAVVSGKVTFSDGNQADWYFDQTGRLGIVPQQAGYQPTAADVQQFQVLLDTELSKLGL
jgi:hypothetical protein